MNDRVLVTVLVENSVQARGLKAEHGWAALVEIGGRHVLLDTGQSALLLDNARALGCRLDRLDAVVLSHGHYDHTGGLAAVLRACPSARVFAHPAALEPKFSVRPDGAARGVGMPDESRRALTAPGTLRDLRPASREVVPGLMVTGEIPRRTGFEDVGGAFFLDRSLRQPDPLADDQAVFFHTPAGVVVVLGCAHAGVVNTLEHIERLTDGARVHAILGGMHLLNASVERLAATVAAFRRREVARLLPAHCTGLGAVARLWESFPGRCAAAGVGSRFTFGG